MAALLLPPSTSSIMAKNRGLNIKIARIHERWKTRQIVYRLSENVSCAIMLLWHRAFHSIAP
jgi:hypothetical protein